MGNECFLSFTTSHLPLYTQNLAKYRLQIVEPPPLPLEKKPKPDKDGPDIKPNLWMWVNPNIVYPLGKLEVEKLKKKDLQSVLPSCHPARKRGEASCSKASGAQSWLPSSRQPSSCKRKQKQKQKHSASSPSTCKELTDEEEAKDQDDSSSVALPSLPTRAPLQSQRRLRQAVSPEGRLWSRPPLNYFHLIALALRNSPSCGLNVQQIYSFTREHFPFFRTAPEGWKNTIRHNLCFRDSFEKVPVSMQGEASTPPRSCLWKLTEEGHRRFAEEARTLASTRLESIQQCMSQPDVMPFLFDLQEEPDMPY
ncbi:forkhead box protein R1 [Peromyscus eremicus]|uniref:forkhead box protein R1 n=1 Tax=Peromyscus eremicus TaxID=42410 RepID=UPI0027DDC748|nr:forkhead box protein R1 [Peromyscus eremicus]